MMIKNTGEHYLPIQENKKMPALIPMNLHFFDGEKTEKATPKKKTKAREEGQVAKSTEIGTAFLFVSVFTALRAFSPYMVRMLSNLLNYSFVYMGGAGDVFTVKAVTSYINYMFMQVLLIVLPIFLVAMVIGVITNIVQVGWHPTTKPLKPKFSKLNPLKGFKRMFSMRSLVELIKSIAKFAVILITIYSILKKEFNSLSLLLGMELFQSVGYIADVAITIGLNVGFLYLFIAAADFAYARFKHSKELRMSKQEVKEEYKLSEGNPQIKSAIRQRMREASMRRMMQDIPSADVIITNPTHFAVALKYDKDKGEAPKVVAKGVDFLALKIKDIAKEHKIVVVENKPLARTLYATVDIGREIPPELYQTVAEILAYVYKLKNIA